MEPLIRAYSVLTVTKAVDDPVDGRIIEGMATTPSTDRVGDIVEPLGAQFSLPIPLLLHHDSTQPIGEVFAAKQQKDGIAIRARIAQTDEPGKLKDRLDEAWQSVKIGLIRGLSIGFKSIEAEDIKGTWGQRFVKWLWLELSAVTIPANQDASIMSVKACDTVHQAASGQDRRSLPGVSGAQQRRSAIPMTPTERRSAFEAKRHDTLEKMEALQAAADKRGESKNEQERDEFESLNKDLETIEREIKDATLLESLSAKQSRPVVETPAAVQPGLQVRDNAVINVSDIQLPQGVPFARSVMCEMQAHFDHKDALALAKQRYPSHTALHRFMEHKAAVPAATTTQTVWAAPLVYTENLANQFIDFLRPMTIVGKFGQNGIPDVTRIPFNSRVNSQTGDGQAYWVGEGAGKPVTSVPFSAVTVPHDKVATIAVLTKETIRLSSPSAELLVRNSLSRAIVTRIDRTFIDPAAAAVSDVSPASITNGLTALSSAGTSADNVITDIGKILAAYSANNYNDPAGLVLIMPSSLAMIVGLMRNALGQRMFPDLGMGGGTLEGLPVITSNYAANSSGAGNLVIALHAPSLLLADDGNVTVDASDQVSLQMSDAPTINSTTATGASLVSTWQTNSVAIRAEREITWKKSRTDAVVYMDDVNWGSIGSPA